MDLTERGPENVVTQPQPALCQFAGGQEKTVRAVRLGLCRLGPERVVDWMYRMNGAEHRRPSRLPAARGCLR